MFYFNLFAAAFMTTVAVKNFFVGDYALAALETIVAVNGAACCWLLLKSEKTSKSVDPDGKGENYDEWV
ncbi:MAG: hypothetical protein IKU86_12330 [Thermoguttaceae bacterium]|nr:hypothetical protein [Thermoguttaceae bacterium]